MNDQQTQLLEKLAQQMGTTAEYLWGILLKQAPIDAAWNVVQYSIFILATIILFKAHRRLSKKEDRYTGYDNSDFAAPVMVVLGTVWAVVLLVAFFALPRAFTGFYNPEYWAIQQILTATQQ